MASTESSDQQYEESNPPPEVDSTECTGPAEEEPGDAHVDRLKSIGVTLITLIAALGALVTWRAEVAATMAAQLTQQGVVISINLAAEQAKDRAIALNEEADVMRVQQALDERDLLGEQVALASAGPAKDQLTTMYQIQFWVAEWRLRNVWTSNFYIRNAATTPIYNVAGRTADLVSESRIPTDSASSFAQADREQSRRRYLLFLDIGLVIGLSCATVAQLTRRRMQLLCVMSGTAVFILGVIVLGIVEA